MSTRARHLFAAKSQIGLILTQDPPLAEVPDCVIDKSGGMHDPVNTQDPDSSAYSAKQIRDVLPMQGPPSTAHALLVLGTIMNVPDGNPPEYRPMEPVLVSY
jgi:hypothetical protein